MSCADIFLGFIAILFPPIAVWVKSGLCTADSFINIALCCLGYLPGLIHAWYIIARNPDEYERIPDSERGGDERVTYYYISQDQQPRAYGASNARAGGKPVAARPAPQGVAAGPSQPSGEEIAPPPSYNDTVKGDHKVQTRD